MQPSAARSPAVTDLEGFTYLQQERQGLLLGVYERNPRHWKVEGADWDFGQDLLPTELDRIAPELEIGFARFPVLQRAGIKRWVNGAFTFTPDGNPLVGPVPGLRNYWVGLRLHGGFLARRRHRIWRSATGWSRAIPAPTSSAWTWRATHLLPPPTAI